MTAAGPEIDPRFIAALDLVGRTGAKWTQIRYSDDEEPVVWFIVAGYEKDGRKGHQVGASFDPVTAALALLDQLIDGARCTHCNKPSGVVADPGDIPFGSVICWYQYDPELQTFRRGCEGD